MVPNHEPCEILHLKVDVVNNELFINLIISFDLPVIFQAKRISKKLIFVLLKVHFENSIDTILGSYSPSNSRF